MEIPQVTASAPGGDWFVVQTKPRQELRSLNNLEAQGYVCFLPLFLKEKLLRGRLQLVEEPLFPRYLFINLSSGADAISWAPIRSTRGVSGLVRVGDTPARIDKALIEDIQQHEASIRSQPERRFAKGDRLEVTGGPFSGMAAIFEMSSGEARAMVLIELLGKSTRLTLHHGELSRLDQP